MTKYSFNFVQSKGLVFGPAVIDSGVFLPGGAALGIVVEQAEMVEPEFTFL